MTQVSRYGHMLKLRIDGMRVRVDGRYRVDGSVLDDTIEGRAVGVETSLEIDSPDAPALVARVVRNAERGCFVMQSLLQPVAVTARTVLNGAPLAREGPELPARDASRGAGRGGS